VSHTPHFIFNHQEVCSNQFQHDNYLRLLRSTRRRVMRFLGDFFGDRFLDFFFPPLTVGTTAGAGASGAGVALRDAKMSMYPGPRALEREGRIAGSIICLYVRTHLVKIHRGGKLETALETRVQVTKWVQTRIKTATMEPVGVECAWKFSLASQFPKPSAAIKRTSPGRGNKSSKKK